MCFSMSRRRWVFRNLILQPEVVEQRFRAIVLSHHDQQASDHQTPIEHVRLLPSNMLLLNLIPLIDLNFFNTHAFSSSLTLRSHVIIRAVGLCQAPFW